MKKTIHNLANAFIGESQARNRYTFYAKVAKKEGFEQIAGIFRETADQEKEHASQLFKLIQELKKESSEDLSVLTVEAEAPTTIGTTVENLKAAIAGENYEHTSMYPEFASKAKEEGLPAIEARFKSIAIAEAHHEERYAKLLKEVEAGTIFKKDKEVTWVCRECGYVHIGKEAPIECPACKHAQAYYQVQCEIY